MTQYSHRGKPFRLEKERYSALDLQREFKIPKQLSICLQSVAGAVLAASIPNQDFNLRELNYHRQLQSALLDRIKASQWSVPLNLPEEHSVDYQAFIVTERKIIYINHSAFIDGAPDEVRHKNARKVSEILGMVASEFNGAYEWTKAANLSEKSIVRAHYIMETYFRQRLIIPKPGEVEAIVRSGYSNAFLDGIYYPKISE